MKVVKILGINDDVTTCECCGKVNLKRTVVLDTGEGVVHFGTECAVRATKTTTLHVKRAAREAGRNGRPSVVVVV